MFTKLPLFGNPSYVATVLSHFCKLLKCNGRICYASYVEYS